MRGQKALLELRRSGSKPAAVFVSVLDGAPIARGFLDAEDMGDQIDVVPNDLPETLDLRCLTGCVVIVVGTDPERAERVARRAQAFNPAEVITTAGQHFSHWKPNA